MDEDIGNLDSMQNGTISVTFPTSLLAQIEAQAGSNFVDREEFIRSAVRRYLEYLHDVSTTSMTEGA